MSIPKSESCKKLGGEGRRVTEEKETTEDHTVIYHVRILKEESMVKLISTNIGFFFFA